MSRNCIGGISKKKFNWYGWQEAVLKLQSGLLFLREHYPCWWGRFQLRCEGSMSVKNS